MFSENSNKQNCKPDHREDITYVRERWIVLGKHLHGWWENLVDGYILVSPEMLTDFSKGLT